MTDTFGTAAMSEALPSAGQNDQAPTPGTQGYDASQGRWTEPQAIDYTSMATGSGGQEWGCNARAYAWQDEYGDVGPKFPELELELFGNPTTRHDRVGLDFSR
jgi:ATP-dependent RNA helicase DDX3X